MKSLVGLCMLEQMNSPVPVQFKVACGTWLVCGVGWNVRTGINVTTDWNFSMRHGPFAGRRRVSVRCGCTAALDQGTAQFGAMEIGAVEIGRVLSSASVAS